MKRPLHTEENEINEVVVRGRKRWDALGLFTAELDKEVGWTTGMVFTGLTLSKKAEGWMLVVRATGKKGAMVTFLNAPTLTAVWRLLWVMLYKGRIKWKVDQFNRKG